jgi:hypothetical protein
VPTAAAPFLFDQNPIVRPPMVEHTLVVTESVSRTISLSPVSVAMFVKPAQFAADRPTKIVYGVPATTPEYLSSVRIGAA